MYISGQWLLVVHGCVQEASTWVLIILDFLSWLGHRCCHRVQLILKLFTIKEQAITTDMLLSVAPKPVVKWLHCRKPRTQKMHGIIMTPH